MRPLLSWRRFLLCSVPAGALLLRLIAQPEHLEDGEGQIPATVARELFLGGASDVFHYQLIPYQGSLVLDPLLALPGHALFGDHLVAWFGLAVLYCWLLAYGAATVLSRCGFSAGQWVAPLMFAGMPFFLKDGLLAMIGGHAVGIVYGVLALAFAVHGERSGRARWWPLVAGLVWALGCWYVRTTYIVLPALLLAVAPLGRGAWVRLGLGGLLLPCLLLANAQILVNQVPRYEQADVIALSIELATGVASGSTHETPESYPRSQLHEATGWIFRDMLFAQPSGTTGDGQALPGAEILGLVWVLAWLAGLPLLLLALGVARRRGPDRWGESDRVRALRVAAIVVLALSYVVAYVVSPQRIELAAVNQALTTFAFPPAPEVNPVRYLIPVGLAWTLLLAVALSALWAVPRLRSLAALILALTAGMGCVLGVLDVTFQRSPDGFATMRASNYWSISLPGRLPPVQVHRRALNADPDSRQYRFRALGFLAVPPPGAESESQVAAVQRLRAQVLRDLALGKEDWRWFYDGLGGGLANQIQDGEGRLRAAAVSDIREVAASLIEPADRDAFLKGVVEALPDRAGFDPELFLPSASGLAPTDQPEQQQTDEEPTP